jgi:hypothetical protein
LHLHLYAFFDNTSSPNHRTDLLDLYYAATAFLDLAFEMDKQSKLIYSTNYMFQMLMAAGFALLKLLNSEYNHRLQTSQGRHYFTNTVRAVRSTSVAPNDLPMRLAEVLAQLWHASGKGDPANYPKPDSPETDAFEERRPSFDVTENPLRLKVRSRMSQSVVFDSIWRWRETQVNASARLDDTVVTNPTNPDSSSNSTPPPGASNSLLTISSLHPTSAPGSTTMANAPGSGTPNIPALDAQPSLDPTTALTAAAAAAAQGSGPMVSGAGHVASGQALNMPLGMVNGLAFTSPSMNTANSYELFDSVGWFLDANPMGMGSATSLDWGLYGFGSGGEGGFSL